MTFGSDMFPNGSCHQSAGRPMRSVSASVQAKACRKVGTVGRMGGRHGGGDLVRIGGGVSRVAPEIRLDVDQRAGVADLSENDPPIVEVPSHERAVLESLNLGGPFAHLAGLEELVIRDERYLTAGLRPAEMVAEV